VCVCVCVSVCVCRLLCGKGVKTAICTPAGLPSWQTRGLSTGADARDAHTHTHTQATGLLAQVRALQRRSLLSAKDGDDLFALLDSNHPGVLAMHRHLRDSPPAEEGAEEEAMAAQLRDILLHKENVNANANVAVDSVDVGDVGPQHEVPVGAAAQMGVRRVAGDVVIPECPRGRLLRMYIWSTWGDVYYVGLNGIEIYDGDGAPVVLADPVQQITANPPDINILEGYSGDPRTVDNLMDGDNCTCDDLNVWLAPFSQGKANEVVIDLGQETELSMVRIWNYNKSRIHAARGARHVELFFDHTCVFAGEIACAPGNLVDAEDRAEILLFTQAEDVLQALARSMDEQRLQTLPAAVAEKGGDWQSEVDAVVASLDSVLGERPSTPGEETAPRPASSLVPPPSRAGDDAQGIKGRQLKIFLQDTWGDLNYVGLTGLQVVVRGGRVLDLTDAQLTASPQDLNEIPGNSGDPRTKDKLLNNLNITCDDRNMWLIPFTKGGEHKLVLALGAEPQEVVEVRFWNYNKSPEDAGRGAKTVHLRVDNVAATPACGVCLRKAPGHTEFDFGHSIAVRPQALAPVWTLPASAGERPRALERLMGQCRQDSDPPALPRGLTVSLSLTGPFCLYSRSLLLM